MGVKHIANSALRKFWALSQLCHDREVCSYEMPNVSYCQPLPVNYQYYSLNLIINNLNI